MDTLKFTTAEGLTLTLEPGAVLVVGWTRNGDAPAGTVHLTETVVAVVETVPGEFAVILSGGKYKNGAMTRTLQLTTAKGTPTKQIRSRLI